MFLLTTNSANCSSNSSQLRFSGGVWTTRFWSRRPFTVISGGSWAEPEDVKQLQNSNAVLVLVGILSRRFSMEMVGIMKFCRRRFIDFCKFWRICNDIFNIEIQLVTFPHKIFSLCVLWDGNIVSGKLFYSRLVLVRNKGGKYRFIIKLIHLHEHVFCVLHDYYYCWRCEDRDSATPSRFKYQHLQGSQPSWFVLCMLALQIDFKSSHENVGKINRNSRKTLSCRYIVVIMRSNKIKQNNKGLRYHALGRWREGGLPLKHGECAKNCFIIA